MPNKIEQLEKEVEWCKREIQDITNNLIPYIIRKVNIEALRSTGRKIEMPRRDTKQKRLIR